VGGLSKNLSIAVVLAKIPTEYLPNIRPWCYCYTNPLSGCGGGGDDNEIPRYYNMFLFTQYQYIVVERTESLF
jgi:hypothetical protein